MSVLQRGLNDFKAMCFILQTPHAGRGCAGNTLPQRAWAC